VGNETVSTPGTPLRNSLWNLLFRVVSSTDFSKIAWTTVLRGAALAFFREPIDELPLTDNDASRLALKERFFGLPEHRVFDLFEFLLADDRAGLKELDRKLIRRSVNELLEREAAPVRLYRDRFRPFQGALEFDGMAAAEEAVSLFDLAAARRHLDAAYAYLSRRPEPEARGALREAVLAVAAVALEVAQRDGGEGDAAPRLVVGSVAHAAKNAGIRPDLLPGIEALLRRAHAISGLPAGPEEGEAPREAEGVDPREAHLLVVFASSLVHYLLGGHSRSKQGTKGESVPRQD